MATASLPDANMEVKPKRELRRVRNMTSVAVSQYEERVRLFVSRLTAVKRNLDSILSEVSEMQHMDLNAASEIRADIKYSLERYDNLSADFVAFLKRQR